jgi:hypothetical protein
MARLVRNGGCLFLVDTLTCGSATVEATRLAAGRLAPTSTADRGQTMNPLSNFVCDGTPLGKGHLIALFLGGPDIVENYAPQYEQWQQCGPWKAMEEGLKSDASGLGAARLYMVVELTYGRTGNTYAAEVLEFQGGHVLREWTDFRIPTRFRIWKFLSTAAGASPVIALLEGADTGQALNALQSLPAATFLTAVRDFDHSTMPEQDYQQWKGIFIRGVAKRLAEEAKARIVPELANAERKELARKKSGVTRLGHGEHARIARDVKTKLGFNGPTESVDRWKLDNLDRIATEVVRLINSRPDRYCFSVADVAALKGAGAENVISSYILKS